jgi:hypothetical protein
MGTGEKRSAKNATQVAKKVKTADNGEENIKEEEMDNLSKADEEVEGKQGQDDQQDQHDFLDEEWDRMRLDSILVGARPAGSGFPEDMYILRGGPYIVENFCFKITEHNYKTNGWPEDIRYIWFVHTLGCVLQVAFYKGVLHIGGIHPYRIENPAPDTGMRSTPATCSPGPWPRWSCSRTRSRRSGSTRWRTGASPGS